MLAGVGADSASAGQRWEPYLSLQPAMVLARARRSLSPPASTVLTLANDTLRFAGTAPLPWVITAGRASLPPGVAAMDLSGVTAEIPADLARLAREIERQRVLFDIGSADLSSGPRGVISQVATALQRLDAGASLIGARATLELVGRTDPTGSDSANQALSRERAIAVVTALAARGVPTGTARVERVGTAVRWPRESPDERARINRSVSFGVSHRDDPEKGLYGRAVRHREDQPGTALRALAVLRALSLDRRREDRPQVDRGRRRRPSRSCSGILPDGTGTRTSPPATCAAPTRILYVVDGTRRKPAISFRAPRARARGGGRGPACWR